MDDVLPCCRYPKQGAAFPRRGVITHSLATQQRGLLGAAMAELAGPWPPPVGAYAEERELFRLLQVNGPRLHWGTAGLPTVLSGA